MTDTKFIRNFSIIAHIDHGKSTMADRMIEITKTVEARHMKDQILDDMELERERGITIKMRPVRMEYVFEGQNYVLNLIDTPGHIDFSYEVSRALKAVEGSILLVDSTQGVQAQTLTTLEMARAQGLTIIPVLSKIDSPLARIDEVCAEIMQLLNCTREEIMFTSGKTGEGVEKLLQQIIRKIPAPETTEATAQGKDRSLIFDFQYSNHRGIILYVRVFDGSFKATEEMSFVVAGKKFFAAEVGTFRPKEKPEAALSTGEIGYIVTGIKEPGVASVGDTITKFRNQATALPGYELPKPVVWASIFPESQDDFELLRTSLFRLKLSDSSLVFEEESSGNMGRGFRCGLLGMLHLEIVTERLKREFNLELVVTLPSINYIVHLKNGKTVKAYTAAAFPNYGDIVKIEEPWVTIKIITPNDYLGAILTMLYEHEAIAGDTESLPANRSSITADLPLRELMRNFFDELKSISSGYASFSYKVGDFLEADVVKMEMLVADEEVQAFSRVVSRARMQEEGEKAVEKLSKILPRQMFTTKIQAKALGRIISSHTLSALRKNVTAHLYGGDITRKMKLREKQKKGKKKMAEMGTVKISHDVFIKMMRGGE